MPPGVGTEHSPIHVRDAERIAGYHEAIRTLDETCQCAVEMILADVLRTGIGDKHTTCKHRHRTIVGIVAACLPLLSKCALFVIDLYPGREKQVEVVVVDSHIAYVAADGEILLQTPVEPIQIDIILCGYHDLVVHQLECGYLVGSNKPKRAAIGRHELHPISSILHALRLLGIIEEVSRIGQHLPQATPHDSHEDGAQGQ